MPILTEEQTKEIIDGAIDEIRAAVIDQATQEAAWKTTSTVASTVTEIVNEFVRGEIAPEIITSLQEQKSLIIEAAVTSANDMAVMIAKAMTSTLAENLGKSYGRKKILEAMFD